MINYPQWKAPVIIPPNSHCVGDAVINSPIPGSIVFILIPGSTQLNQVLSWSPASIEPGDQDIPYLVQLSWSPNSKYLKHRLHICTIWIIVVIVVVITVSMMIKYEGKSGSRVPHILITTKIIMVFIENIRMIEYVQNMRIWWSSTKERAGQACHASALQGLQSC